jgi:microcystin-dependent protein
MADPFVAEIRIFPFNFAPTGWALCDGQLMPLSQNTALFSLLGTTYGGNGKSTFGLPDLQDRAPMHPGQGPGLSARDLGQSGGTQTVTLLESEVPVHTHSVGASGDLATETQPPGRRLATGDGVAMYNANNLATVTLAAGTLAPAGGSLPHTNMQPFLTLQFCIALQGVFPPRGP